MTVLTSRELSFENSIVEFSGMIQFPESARVIATITYYSLKTIPEALGGYSCGFGSCILLDEGETADFIIVKRVGDTEFETTLVTEKKLTPMQADNLLLAELVRVKLVEVGD